MDRSNVSDALFPHRCQRGREQKPLTSRGVCRKCYVIYREINGRFGRIARGTAKRKFHAAGSSRAIHVVQKSLEDLAADVFAFRSAPQGRDVVHASATKRSDPGLPTNADGVPPTDFVCRHACSKSIVRRALKDRFSESLIRVVSSRPSRKGMRER